MKDLTKLPNCTTIYTPDSSTIEFFIFLRGILRVGFKNGSIYEYKDVPPLVFWGLLVADSKGSYFMSKIRKHYLYRLVAPIRQRGWAIES